MVSEKDQAKKFPSSTQNSLYPCLRELIKVVLSLRILTLPDFCFTSFICAKWMYFKDLLFQTKEDENGYQIFNPKSQLTSQPWVYIPIHTSLPIPEVFN